MLGDQPTTQDCIRDDDPLVRQGRLDAVRRSLEALHGALKQRGRCAASKRVTEVFGHVAIEAAQEKRASVEK